MWVLIYFVKVCKNVYKYLYSGLSCMTKSYLRVWLITIGNAETIQPCTGITGGDDNARKQD